MELWKVIGLSAVIGLCAWLFTPWLIDPGWILMANGVLFLTATAMSVVGLVSRILPRGTGEVLTLALATLVLQLLCWIFLDPLNYGENGWGLVALILSGALTWAFLGPLVLSEENAFGAIGMLGTTFSGTSMIFLESYLEAIWTLPLLIIFLIQVLGWMRPKAPPRDWRNRRARRRTRNNAYRGRYLDSHNEGRRRRRHDPRSKR